MITELKESLTALPATIAFTNREAARLGPVTPDPRTLPPNPPQPRQHSRDKSPTPMALSADDRFAILDVIHAYNLAADNKDVDATLAHYVEEGWIDGDMETGRGREAMRRDLPAIFAPEVTLKRHIACNVRFGVLQASEEVDVHYILFVMEGKAAAIPIATSMVTDRFRRTDAGWKVVHHHVEVDPSSRWLVKAGQKGYDALQSLKAALG